MSDNTTTIGRAVVDVVSCSVTTTDSFEIDREVSISFRNVIEKWHLGFWPKSCFIFLLRRRRSRRHCNKGAIMAAVGSFHCVFIISIVVLLLHSIVVVLKLLFIIR